MRTEVALAETVLSLPGDLDMISGNGHRLNGRAVQQQVEFAPRRLTPAGRATRTSTVSAALYASLKTEDPPSWKISPKILDVSANGLMLGGQAAEEPKRMFLCGQHDTAQPPPDKCPALPDPASP